MITGMTLNKCDVLQIGAPSAGTVILVHVKEPNGSLNMVTCSISSCKPECIKYISAYIAVSKMHSNEAILFFL